MLNQGPVRGESGGLFRQSALIWLVMVPSGSDQIRCRALGLPTPGCPPIAPVTVRYKYWMEVGGCWSPASQVQS
jgi:hypothetical protein